MELPRAQRRVAATRIQVKHPLYNFSLGADDAARLPETISGTSITAPPPARLAYCTTYKWRPVLPSGYMAGATRTSRQRIWPLNHPSTAQPGAGGETRSQLVFTLYHNISKRESFSILSRIFTLKAYMMDI